MEGQWFRALSALPSKPEQSNVLVRQTENADARDRCIIFDSVASKLVADKLSSFKVDGSVPTHERQQQIAKFQSGDVKVAL